ncbi:hypothetical protein Hypma_010943 [Hypsizygus marmoreus]|uniref:Uncharacterized protein n=1 Tax=Hypsizygus marmoreus TaxID=39966 RepID=A0A369JHW1_HYPMA|nr:hypothetical protein Hypma_010943 [Hypsizygus marmoreus]
MTLDQTLYFKPEAQEMKWLWPHSKRSILGRNWIWYPEESDACYSAIHSEHPDLSAAEEDAKKICARIAFLDATATAIAVPCLFTPAMYYPSFRRYAGRCSEFDAELKKTPVIHLTIQTMAAIATAPITALPVHVHVAGSDFSLLRRLPAPNTYLFTPNPTWPILGAKDQITRPDVLGDLNIGDTLEDEATNRQTVLGAFPYGDDGATTYGITCGHLVANEPYQASEPTNIYSPSLSDIYAKLSVRPPPTMESFKQRREGIQKQITETDDKYEKARLEKLNEYFEVCDHPEVRHVGVVCAGEVGYIDKDSSHQIADWLLFKVSQRNTGNHPYLWGDVQELVSDMPVYRAYNNSFGPGFRRWEYGVVNGIKACCLDHGRTTMEFPIFMTRDSPTHYPNETGCVLMTHDRDPLGLVFASPAPNRSYALVTPLSVLIPRIEDLTGIQLSFKSFDELYR